jgi:hypothetical protein
MAKDFKIKQGNTAPLLKAVLQRLNDEGEVEGPADLTGVDTVTFTMRNKTSLVVQVDEGAADVVGDPTLGEVEYEWQPGDTDIAGNFLGEFDVLYTNGKTETFPNGEQGFPIKITAQLSV